MFRARISEQYHCTCMFVDDVALACQIMIVKKAKKELNIQFFFLISGVSGRGKH